jgi:hypothetical protein
MIAKKDFISKMSELQNINSEFYTFRNFTYKYFGGYDFELVDKLFEIALKYLCELMNDDFNDGWIPWFVYENDWGNKGFEAGIANGKTKVKSKKIKTTSQLYDLIVKMNEGK